MLQRLVAAVVSEEIGSVANVSKTSREIRQQSLTVRLTPEVLNDVGKLIMHQSVPGDGRIPGGGRGGAYGGYCGARAGYGGVAACDGRGGEGEARCRAGEASDSGGSRHCNPFLMFFWSLIVSS